MRPYGDAGVGCGFGGGRGAGIVGCVFDAQSLVDDLQFGSGDARDILRPGKLLGFADTLAIARHTFHQTYRQLRPEARRQSQCVTNVVMAAAREVESSQLRIDFLVVGYRRHNLVLEHSDRNRVLDAHSHWMSCETFSVGDYQLLGIRAECVPQCVHFGAGAPAAGGCISLVRYEDRLWRYLVPIEAVLVFHAFDEGVHRLGNVFDVKACAVESAVDDNGTEQPRDSADPPPTAF